MASKVADKAQIRQPKEDEKAPVVEPREAKTDELIQQITGEAVRQTMAEFMPMFASILDRVASQQQTPAQAQVQVQEGLTTAQGRAIRDMNRDFDKRVKRNKEFMQKIASAPAKDFVIMSIPRVFQKYFGSELPVGWNGSTIQVPINGRPFRVHKGFVPHIQRALNYEDQKVAFMEQSDFDDTQFVEGLEILGRS